MTVSATINSIRDLMCDDLALLNQTISTALQSSIPSINLISHHITNNQGKRLRPIITLLAAKACDCQNKQHITLATIIELIHTATLLHDDVVDESTQRRGHITANAKWGNPISVLVGDFLYSRSFQLMAQLNHPQVFSVLADTTNVIAEGEVLQLIHSNQTDIDVATYLKVIHYKTAKLFESAAQLGSIIAQAPITMQSALSNYGRHFGMAYQIIDDALDYVGENKRLGKNTGDDFKQGKVTLPLIYTMQSADAKQRQALHDHINSNKIMTFDQALALIKEHNALEKTMQLAQSEGNQAKCALDCLTDSPYKDALLELISFTLTRDY